MLLRLDEPNGGSTHWKGRDLFQLSLAELYQLRRELRRMFQDPT
jgi:peptide/nickel transport system ATP-binding protein